MDINKDISVMAQEINNESKMKDKIDIRLVLKQGVIFSKSDFEKKQFRLSECKSSADSDNLPMRRDDAW